MASNNKSTKKSSKKTVKKSTKKEERKAKKEPTIVVLFFANWCGHCQAMYPEWEKLKKEYKNNDDFILREIEHGNIEYEKPLLEKEYDMSPNQVHGFPTLTKFHPHEEVEYYEGGERTKGNIMNWLQGNKDKKVDLDMMRFPYGGYKIPFTGKIKVYSKNKTTKKKSKSNKKKTNKITTPIMGSKI